MPDILQFFVSYISSSSKHLVHKFRFKQLLLSSSLGIFSDSFEQHSQSEKVRNENPFELLILFGGTLSQIGIKFALNGWQALGPGVVDFNLLCEAMHGILIEIAKNSKRGFSEDSKTDDKTDFPSNQAGPSLSKTIICHVGLSEAVRENEERVASLHEHAAACKVD